MTPGERSLWLAVFAASWHQSTGRQVPGVVLDRERAEYATGQAWRALHAIRDLAVGQTFGPALAEVLE